MSFDICFRVCQSADHMLFRLQNGDLTCYEMRKPEWHSVAVYSVYSTVQLVDWPRPGALVGIHVHRAITAGALPKAASTSCQSIQFVFILLVKIK